MDEQKTIPLGSVIFEIQEQTIEILWFYPFEKNNNYSNQKLAQLIVAWFSLFALATGRTVKNSSTPQPAWYIFTRNILQTRLS
jgi:hypothetical protein